MFAKIKKLLKNQNTTPSEQAIELKKKADAYVREENYQQAVSCYQQAINISPQYADALIGLGHALSEQGLLDDAAQYLQQVLSITPNSVDAHFMLGNIAQHKEDLQQAVVHYNKALQANSNFEFAYHELFAVYQALGNISSAKEVLERAIIAIPTSTNLLFTRASLYFSEKNYQQSIFLLQKILQQSPNHIASLRNLAQSYIQLSQDELAIPYLQQLLKLKPEDVDIYEDIANIYLKLDKNQDALFFLNEVVRLNPNSPLKHLVASLSGQTTDTAPVEYVQKLFDHYAEKFESHLTKTLHYDVPTQLVAMIQANLNQTQKKWIVLDLGCGTGLFGQAISPFAQQIVGIDLSQKMLEKAKQHNVYHRLEHADLLQGMQKDANNSYDIIASTDVFIYVGKLDEVVLEVKRLLKHQGIFAFSVESTEDLFTTNPPLTEQDFILTDSGRYAHSMAYLNRLAQDAGFKILQTKHEAIRLHKDSPIMGYLLVWMLDTF